MSDDMHAGDVEQRLEVERLAREVSLWKIATGASVPEHAQQALHNLRGDLARAEADNAALMEAARGPLIDASDPRGNFASLLTAVQNMGTIVNAPHPGAALLERMRLAERLRSLATHDEACHLAHNADWGTPNPERCALCAYDALEKTS